MGICTKHYRSGNGELHRSPQPDTEAVVFKFGNGADVIVAIADLPQSIITISAAHGIAQKIGDAYAGCEGDIDLAQGMAEAMKSRLFNNEWNTRGEGGPAVNMLAKALDKATGCGLGAAVEKVGGMTKEEKADLRKNPQIAAIIAGMEAERAALKAAELAARAANAPPLPI